MNCPDAMRTMLTLRTTSPVELFDRLEQQLSQQLQTAERVPAAEVHETPEAYTVVLELPGVAKDSIDVKATDRTLMISAERLSSTELQPDRQLMSEFRYGTWSRAFRFPASIDREQIKARYRDGLLTVTAAKAATTTHVRVAVDS